MDCSRIFCGLYFARHYLPENADYVLARIETALVGLSDSPERGAYPIELLALGIREYREIFFKPYRIIYRIAEMSVFS